jgi:hypothetical protein
MCQAQINMGLKYYHLEIWIENIFLFNLQVTR